MKLGFSNIFSKLRGILYTLRISASPKMKKARMSKLKSEAGLFVFMM
jgi:hypothetical protein